jgi:hypothetical protein
MVLEGSGLMGEAVEVGGGTAALGSGVVAALAPALRHAAVGPLGPRAEPIARHAVRLARECADPAALASALLSLHDVMWTPGAAEARLAVLAEMSDAAHAAVDPDLEAEAVLLRAAALIERGDPRGPTELARYTRLADRIGTAHGRWGALSRRATLAQLAGRAEEAVAFADQARDLGTAIGLPDAEGVFATLRCSLAVLGAPLPFGADAVPVGDPLWPLRPLLRAWLQVLDGDSAGAAGSLSGFSVQTVPAKYDLEMVAVTAATVAAVGTDDQREWAYRAFAPHAGLHAVVGGCAAYHGAVDHHLGLIAAALGRHADAAGHFRAAIAQYDQLGTAGWAELSRAELTRTGPGRTGPDRPLADRDEFRLADGRWQFAFAGRAAHLPDAKGLRDIATLLAAPGRQIHVFALLGRDLPATGADPVLDRTAAAAYRRRLAELDDLLADAREDADPDRVERLRDERAALLGELRAATGLAGRARRLGDDTERARKTVTARIRDTLGRLDHAHPALAAHLRSAVRTGTYCAYLPDQPPAWTL